MGETNGAKAVAPPDAAASKAAAHKKERSPNYPGIGPTEALNYAEMIWKRDKRNPVSSDMACQHMGYKAKNGASLPILAALKRYGLLISVGSELRISDEAHTIFLAPQNHPERVALVKKVAMRPAMFGEVLARFPDGLPSEENLRFRLRHEWAFATDKAADNFIEALKDAVALAGVATAHEMTDSGSDLAVEEPDPNMYTPAITPPAAAPVPRVSPTSPASTTLSPSQMRSWDLGGGAVVSVALPTKLTKGNIEKLKKYIGALEMEASISWDDVEPS